jgi:hypothetical protein
MEGEEKLKSEMLASRNRAYVRAGVVLVNCQLGGRGDEGQPGFTLVLAKAVFCHQWVQSCG